MGRLRDLPLFVVLLGLGAGAMFLPALHAALTQDWVVGAKFAASGLICGTLVTLLGFATLGRPVRNAARSHLLTLVGTFALAPVMLAVPFYAAVPATTFLNTWFEMVSSLTTTGGTLYLPERLADSVHLWRALVGWLGGLLLWIVAIAILAPMNLGGFEITSGAAVGAGARADGVSSQRNAEEARLRMIRHTGELMPVYVGLTVVLWLGLLITGEVPFVALCHAMSVMSTSGISPVGGLVHAQGGIAGEVLIFVFLGLAVTRSSFSRRTAVGKTATLLRDPEVRICIFLVITVPGILFLRHWVGAYDVDVISDLPAALGSLWGAVFSVLSFITTTGFVSADWGLAKDWSGLSTPGMVLLGLGLMGGGVATTAGGVKLLRVYALYKHGQREMDRLVYPNMVGGKGMQARRLRGQGAYVAWISFMLFAVTLTAVATLLTLTGEGFDRALILATAALANCGPVADVVLSAPIPLATLEVPAKLLLGLTMVLGRLETLAILVLMNPDFWRN